MDPVCRAWEAVRILQTDLINAQSERDRKLAMQCHRTSTIDLSEAFDSLLRLTSRGKKAVTLAPFGPKPISAAMCLLACQNKRAVVYYTQPKRYAINYSHGLKDITAYWIKHKGRNLYSLD
jgi:hypothetical protein